MSERFGREHFDQGNPPKNGKIQHTMVTNLFCFSLVTTTRGLILSPFLSLWVLLDANTNGANTETRRKPAGKLRGGRQKLAGKLQDSRTTQPSPRGS